MTYIWKAVDALGKGVIITLALIVAFILGILGMFSESKASTSREEISKDNAVNMAQYRAKAGMR